MFILRDFRFTATVVLRCLWFIDITGWCVHSKIFSFHGLCGLKVSLVHWHNRMMCSFLGNFHFMASVVLRCLWCIDVTGWCVHSKICSFVMCPCVLLGYSHFMTTVVFKVSLVHWRNKTIFPDIFILWPLWSVFIQGYFLWPLSTGFVVSLVHWQ